MHLISSANSAKCIRIVMITEFNFSTFSQKLDDSKLSEIGKDSRGLFSVRNVIDLWNMMRVDHLTQFVSCALEKWRIGRKILGCEGYISFFYLVNCFYIITEFKRLYWSFTNKNIFYLEHNFEPFYAFLC